MSTTTSTKLDESKLAFDAIMRGGEVTAAQIAEAVGLPEERIQGILEQGAAAYSTGWSVLMEGMCAAMFGHASRISIACPRWCEIGREGHLSELEETGATLYHRVTFRGQGWEVELCEGENIGTGDFEGATVSPYIPGGNDLSLADARAMAKAIKKAARLGEAG